jgi:lipopolysaccharide exporter
MGNSESLKHQVVKSSFWVFGANLFSRGISFISTLILARLLTPESFGVIGYGFLIVGAIGLIREVGFNSALIYQKKRIEEAASTALVFITLWSTFLYVLVVLLAPLAAVFFREPRLILLLRVLTISLILNSIANVPMTLLEKDIRFNRRVIPEVINLTVYGIFTALFAFLGFNYWSFVIGTLCADVCQLIVAFRLRPVKIILKPDLALLRELFGFGKNVMGLGILNFGIRNVDDFFVGRMLGTVPLGVYNFAYRIANIPATNITNVLGKVLYPGFTKIADDLKALQKGFIKSLEYVSFITIPLTFYIVLITPDVIRLFFPNWIEAIVPIQLIAYFGGVRSLGSGTGSVFLAKGQPQRMLPISGFQFVFLTVLLYPTIKYFGLKGVCWLVNISMTISFFWSNALLKPEIEINLSRVLKILIPSLIYSIVILSLVIFLNRLIGSGWKYSGLMVKGLGFPFLFLVATGVISKTPQQIWHELLHS